jgi:plasmid stability protein
MRTTLNIDDDLMRAVKVRAAQTDRTITELVEEALRHSLAATEKPAAKEFRFPVSTFSGKGINPEVDINSRGSLYDFFDKHP